MLLVSVIAARRPVAFAEKVGNGWATSTHAVCASGTVEPCPKGEDLLQAMAGERTYDPDIVLAADNDNGVDIGPIRECSHTAIIVAGA